MSIKPRKKDKRPSFRTVWAALEETGRIVKETSLQMKETAQQMQETDLKFQETDRKIAELSKNIGGLSNSFGEFVESLFSPKLWKHLNVMGFNFSKGAQNVKFWKDKQVIAEVDVFLEDDTYAVPVEIKFSLSREQVDEHLERIKKIRQHMDEKGDTHILMGAVAGGTVNEDSCRYAHEKGLYVFVQSGGAVTLAELPRNFKPAQFLPAPAP